MKENKKGQITKEGILSYTEVENLYVYEEIDSTNEELKRLTAKGALHGSLVVANHQTAGKGRLGRYFIRLPRPESICQSS